MLHLFEIKMYKRYINANIKAFLLLVELDRNMSHKHFPVISNVSFFEKVKTRFTN